jgi:hypothetical protein
MTISIKEVLVCNTQNKWQLAWLRLSIKMPCIMLSVVMLNAALFIVMLSVIMLNVVMLSVMVPISVCQRHFLQHK